MRWAISFRDPQVILTALCGLFLVLGFIGLGPAFAYLSVACGSYFALRSAWQSLVQRDLDVNVLMLLAAIGAIVVGYPLDAAVLLFLFSLSSTLEALSMARTRDAIEALVRLRPETAIRVGESGDERVPTASLAVGDRVRVLPFEKVPTDGALVSERASLDESAITGESRPVERTAGELVTGGTQNLDRMFLMEVTAAPGDTTLDRIVALVAEAQENKASGERVSSWFGRRYTVFVMFAFLVSLAVRMLTGQAWGDAIYGAITLLVALSPCALVISTPASTLSALAFAARRGVLVRGGLYVEVAGRVSLVALDKTGTLTEGRPQLVEVCVGHSWYPESVPVSCGIGPDGRGEPCDLCSAIYCWHADQGLTAEAEEALRLAAVAESYSTHPIAQAIVQAARERGIVPDEAEEHVTFPGEGVQVRYRGTEVRIGRETFFTRETDRLPARFREHVEEMQSRGLTGVYMRYKDHWAVFGLRDAIRPEARALVEELRALGVRRVALLTGDNPETARAVAGELGIEEYYPSLTPLEKASLIDRWEREGESVMMVGDGVNDGPSLARASLGVAMGGLGSEVALRAADVVLVQDRIERLPELIRLGRMTKRIIRANLLFAAGVMVGLTLASLVSRLPLPVAVVGHEGSTVLVILNGLRLLRGPGRQPLVARSREGSPARLAGA